jgi:hypothetical protein
VAESVSTSSDSGTPDAPRDPLKHPERFQIAATSGFVANSKTNLFFRSAKTRALEILEGAVRKPSILLAPGMPPYGFAAVAELHTDWENSPWRRKKIYRTGETGINKNSPNKSGGGARERKRCTAASFVWGYS